MSLRVRVVGQFGLSACFVQAQRDESVQQRIEAFDTAYVGIDELDHAQFAPIEQRFLFDGGEETEIDCVHDTATVYPPWTVILPLGIGETRRSM